MAAHTCYGPTRVAAKRLFLISRPNTGGSVTEFGPRVAAKRLFLILNTGGCDTEFGRRVGALRNLVDGRLVYGRSVCHPEDKVSCDQRSQRLLLLQMSSKTSQKKTCRRQKFLEFARTYIWMLNSSAENCEVNLRKLEFLT